MKVSYIAPDLEVYTADVTAVMINQDTVISGVGGEVDLTGVVGEG